MQIKSAKVLCVGAGGIGCELLKTLVCTGFQDIELVGYLECMQRIFLTKTKSLKLLETASAAFLDVKIITIF